jgi:hypothetical protein
MIFSLIALDVEIKSAEKMACSFDELLGIYCCKLTLALMGIFTHSQFKKRLILLNLAEMMF